MYLKLPLLAALCVFLLFSLNACQPENTDESHAELEVASGSSGFLPKGSGWKPNSKLEISILNEPDGPGSASSQWKKILAENVDTYSTFGYNSGSPGYTIPQKFCGDGESQQMVAFMAKSLTTGTIRLREVPAFYYFTHQPCQ